MISNDIPDFVPAELTRLGVRQEDRTLEQLDRYLKLLLEETERVNLTAVRDREEAWRRHVLDSLSLLPLLERDPPGARVIDVGSGGGLPGLPVALCRPDLRLTLLEATAKKARWLERCAAELGRPDLRIVNQRAESCGHDPEHRAGYAAALCRAVGALREIVEYCLPFLAIGGRLLAHKGAQAEEERVQAERAIRELGGGATGVIPAGVAGGVIVIVEKERPTPERYPRPPGRAKKRSL